MRRHVMTTTILVSAGAALLAATAAPAAEMPTRKAGLWEVSVSLEGRNAPSPAIRQCTDAATDQALQNNAGPAGAPRSCAKRDVNRSGDTVTVDSVCTVGTRTTTSHVVITGNFDSAYTMTITSQTEGAQGGPRTTNMTAKWLGPCAADLKPGDMILPGGRKFNVNDARGALPPGLGAPAAPAR
jgi:hypothetical protein